MRRLVFLCRLVLAACVALGIAFILVFGTV